MKETNHETKQSNHEGNKSWNKSQNKATLKGRHHETKQNKAILNETNHETKQNKVHIHGMYCISMEYIVIMIILQHTVRCHYNAVNFLSPSSQIWIHKRHPIPRPNGQVMGCLLCIQILIFILPHSLHWCVQYDVMLDTVITAPDCI